ncbi:MAG: DmsE family decaheme c-type cytochrome, partial [Sulfuricella sp.]
KVLVLCAFIGGAGWMSGALAAGSLPDMSPAATAKTALNKDAVCTKCHDESETKPILAIYQTKHGVKGDSRTPACQSCHGDSEKHLHGDPKQKGRAQPDVIFGTKKGASSGFLPSETKVQNAACLACHDKDLNRTHWDGGQHQANDVACVSCHEIHNAHDKVRERKTQTQVCFACHKEQRADTHKISTHPIDAGKVICSDCHNPHGSAGPKLLKKNTVNETCFTCHAEKRGPFLFEHQPVNEDCTNCHTPHGSNITPLLKDRPPFLCDECHDGPHNSRQPYGTGAAGIQGGLLPIAAPNNNATGRACMNCHVMVHGTNSPAGAFLHR